MAADHKAEEQGQKENIGKTAVAVESLMEIPAECFCTEPLCCVGHRGISEPR